MAKEVFQLEVQIKSAPALAGLRGINKEAERVKKTVEGVGKTNNLTNLTKQINTTSTAFKGLSGVISGLALGALSTAVVRTVADFETLNTVLGTVTGSAQGAAEGMKLIQDVSKTTPFTIDQIGNTFIKLKASGIDPTRESMQLFADVASVTTDKIGSLRAITDLYSRTTAGGLGLEELNRLADRGIPVFDILGKRLGVTRLQLSELGKTSEGAALILRQLEQGLKQQFAGNAAKQMGTLNGQFDILKKNLEGLAIGVGTAGLTKGLTDLLKVLNQVIVSSDGTAQTIGQSLGNALSSLARGISAVIENFEAMKSVLLGIAIAAAALFAGKALLGIIAVFRGITVAGRGIPAVVTLISAGFKKLIEISGDAAVSLSKYLSGWKGAAIKFTFWTALIYKIADAFTSASESAAEFFGIGEKKQKPIVDPANLTSTLNPGASNAAGGGRGVGSVQLDTLREDQAKTNDLITGRAKIITVMVDALKQEQSIIGKTAEQVEIQNKLFEAQAAIKLRLINAGKSEAEAEAGSRLKSEESLKISSAISAKYAAERRFQYQEFVKNSNFEISLLGKSSIEIEKQTKLREYLVAQGRLEVATEAEKLKILSQITKEQDARINNSLNKNLEGLNKEIEYLKLSNKEREIRIALDQAAADAGFKNAEELAKKRPIQAGEIRSAVGAKYYAGIDKAGREEIDSLKETIKLNSILDETTRRRTASQMALYRAIDPDGKGENITRSQKDQLNALLATIEAQEKMLEVQKQITDQFADLGSAVSNWVLGSKDGIKQVKLELLKLIALQAYKQFAQGNNNSLVGSFIEGVIGGISGARANGGPVEGGKSYLVGEKGPEIATFKQDGYIIPNSAMMNSRTGNVQSVTVSPSLIIQGSVTGQSELDRAFEEFAGAMAKETEKLIIRQAGAGGIMRAR